MVVQNSSMIQSESSAGQLWLAAQNRVSDVSWIWMIVCSNTEHMVSKHPTGFIHKSSTFAHPQGKSVFFWQYMYIVKYV